MSNVYVTRMIPQEPIDDLRRRHDVEINPHDRPLTREELDAAGPQCRIFANYAVGFNNFDLDAATRRGVILTNTPGVLDEATAHPRMVPAAGHCAPHP